MLDLRRFIVFGKTGGVIAFEAESVSDKVAEGTLLQFHAKDNGLAALVNVSEVLGIVREDCYLLETEKFWSVAPG